MKERRISNVEHRISNAEVTTTATTDTTSRVVTPKQRRRRLDDLRKSSQKNKTFDVNRVMRNALRRPALRTDGPGGFQSRFCRLRITHYASCFLRYPLSYAAGKRDVLCEGFFVLRRVDPLYYKPSKDTFAEDNEASAKGISPTVSEALLSSVLST